MVDLNPVGFVESVSEGVWGASQVGSGSGPATVGERHALLWSGSAESVVDLHPDGFTASEATRVWGASQVGAGNLAGTDIGVQTHALLWNGSAESVVDLNPDGFTLSYAWDISGASQVGYGSGPATGGATHALLWNGTAESAVDLHRYLFASLGPDLSWSQALGISDDGTIVGFAATVGPNHTIYAVVWTPIPEPTALVLFLCGLFTLGWFILRRVA